MLLTPCVSVSAGLRFSYSSVYAYRRVYIHICIRICVYLYTTYTLAHLRNSTFRAELACFVPVHPDSISLSIHIYTIPIPTQDSLWIWTVYCSWSCDQAGQRSEKIAFLRIRRIKQPGPSDGRPSNVQAEPWHPIWPNRPQQSPMGLSGPHGGPADLDSCCLNCHLLYSTKAKSQAEANAAVPEAMLHSSQGSQNDGCRWSTELELAQTTGLNNYNYSGPIFQYSHGAMYLDCSSTWDALSTRTPTRRTPNLQETSAVWYLFRPTHCFFAAKVGFSLHPDEAWAESRRHHGHGRDRSQAPGVGYSGVT